MFANLLEAAGQAPDNTLEAKNFFPVQPQDHAQHAVGGRMLRAHIDDKLVGIKKRLLGSFKVERRERAVPVRHSILTGNLTLLYCPLSIPRLICTHSLSCCRMP